MKKVKPYLILLALVLVIYTIVLWLAPRSINWKISLNAKDTSPYGTYILRNSLSDLFPGQEIKENRKNFFYLNKQATNSRSNLIIINNKASSDKYSIRELLKYINKGNTVFYSSHTISYPLLDTLNIDTRFNYISQLSSKYIPLSIKWKNYTAKDSIHYKYSFYKQCVKLDSCRFLYRILGTSKNNDPNFIQFKIGQGQLFLHLAPLAFSNYNLLKEYTTRYTEDVFAFLPQQKTLWDSSMLRQDKKKQSVFYVIFKHKSLKYAYFLLLLLILIYTLSNIRRKQRIIPVINPPVNSSLKLVESVSHLYTHQADYKDLSTKIIRHFNDFVSRKYHLSRLETSDSFSNKLAAKSSKSPDDIKTLLQLIDFHNSSNTISYQELITLYTAIENFKKPLTT